MNYFVDNFISIYTLLYLPLILCCFIENRKRQDYAMWFFVIAFTLFRGLRWGVGSDWAWYLRAFYELDLNNFYKFVLIDDDYSLKVLDIGCASLMLLCKKLFGTYTSYLLVSNFLILYIYRLVALKFSSRPYLIFCFSICSVNFFPVRQDIANTLFFYGVTCLFTTHNAYFWKFTKDKLYFAFNLFAASFHQTAYVLLPVYLIKKVKFSYAQSVIILVSSFLVGELVSDFLFSRTLQFLKIVSYSMYSIALSYMENPDEYDISNRSLPILNLILNLSFCTYFYSVFQQSNNLCGKNNFKEANVTIIQTLISIFIIQTALYQMFSQTAPVFGRICSYFGLTTAVLFGISYDNLKTKYRDFFIIFIVTYCFYRYYKHFGWFPKLHFPYKMVNII